MSNEYKNMIISAIASGDPEDLQMMIVYKKEVEKKEKQILTWPLFKEFLIDWKQRDDKMTNKVKGTRDDPFIKLLIQTSSVRLRQRETSLSQEGSSSISTVDLNTKQLNF